MNKKHCGDIIAGYLPRCAAGTSCRDHRNSIWPVVVTVDGNISKSDKTDFIVRDGS